MDASVSSSEYWERRVSNMDGRRAFRRDLCRRRETSWGWEVAETAAVAAWAVGISEQAVPGRRWDWLFESLL